MTTIEIRPCAIDRDDPAYRPGDCEPIISPTTHAEAEFYTVYEDRSHEMADWELDLMGGGPWWQAIKDLPTLAEALDWVAEEFGLCNPSVYALPPAKRVTLEVTIEVGSMPYRAEDTIAELECAVDTIIAERWGQVDHEWQHNPVQVIEVKRRES